MRALAMIDAALLQQRGHLFPWTPVFMALGIGSWFALRSEPGFSIYCAVGVAGAGAVFVAWRWPNGWSALGWALAMVALGVTLAGWRAHRVAEPVLSYRYYGPVEGRLVGVDRSASDALRLTLDHVRLDRVPPHRTPARVRLSLHGGDPPDLMPGARLMTTAHLSPPSGPAEPGGFDFRRHAWFQRLGAVGYTRNPVLVADPPARQSMAVWVLALRLAASERVRVVLPGDTGGFAAAVTTGDRSGISRGALDALQQSNLAHLLAISGLHMGLLAGFVFGAVRLGIAGVPYLALRVPGHKWAAVAALVAAAGYLVLSGRNIATERAFIMVALALLAVLNDRRALSLRAVATAALIVLTLRPEALLSPGFQMSFAATTALIAVFGWMRNAPLAQAPRMLRPFVGLVVSSAVAGAATAPVAAAHFNTLAQYGLVANLLSVPLMGLVVIPGAVLALLLAPFGLETLGLFAMGLALDWILQVAHVVSSWPHAVSHVPQPGPWCLPVLSLGLLWMTLWQGWLRVLGCVPTVLALVVWSQTTRPEVLIADTGGLVGVMTDAGRALSRDKGSGFVAGIWLENDGDGAGQPNAAQRWPDGQGRVRVLKAQGWELVHVTGKRAAASYDGCKAGQIIITPVQIDLQGDCEIFDPVKLRGTGSLAIYRGKLVTARAVSGTRLWHR